MELFDYENAGVRLSYSLIGEGAPIYFGHANGFPVGVYEPLLKRLSAEHRVYALNLCSQSRCTAGCSSATARITSWLQLADELAAFLENVVREPVVAVGHSVGAVTSMFAAVSKPHLFKKLIMLEPVLLPTKLIWLIRFMNLIGKGSSFPLSVRARKRRDGWSSREEAYQYFKGKPLFASWDDEMLRAYIEVGLYESEDGGVKLSCPPETEAQVFESYTTAVWSLVRRVKVPTVIVRGGNSDTLQPSAWKLFKRLQPNASMIEIPGCGHLFPMEIPEKTAELILDNV